MSCSTIVVSRQPTHQPAVKVDVEVNGHEWARCSAPAKFKDDHSFKVSRDSQFAQNQTLAAMPWCCAATKNARCRRSIIAAGLKKGVRRR